MALGIPHFQFGRTVRIKLRPFIWLCKSSTCSPTTTFIFTFLLILFEGNIFKKLYLNYTNANTSIWASRNGSQPLNEPLCGYTGKKCPLDFTGLFIGGGSIISVLLIVSIAAVAYAIWYNNFYPFYFFTWRNFKGKVSRAAKSKSTKSHSLGWIKENSWATGWTRCFFPLWFFITFVILRKKYLQSKQHHNTVNNDVNRSDAIENKAWNSGTLFFHPRKMDGKWEQRANDGVWPKIFNSNQIELTGF